jgi:Activator of Hsp90 ATPase homolog 1-like protein
METLTRLAPIRRKFAVSASPERAFADFFGRMNDWSPREHSLSGGLRSLLVIEPFAGGRWYEVGENGQECDWGRVVEWDPPRRALLLWQISSAFAYDPTVKTEVEVTFDPKDASRTIVMFEHRALESLGGDVEVGRAALDSDEGWGGALRAYAGMVERCAA